MSGIRGFLIFALVFCFAASPAGAVSVWLWDKEKTPAQDVPKVYVPHDKSESGFMDKLFNKQTKPETSPLPGEKFKDLRPEMMLASYMPQTVEEIQMIADAQKAWMDVDMMRMMKAAEVRMAAAQAQGEQALQAMKMANQQELMMAQNASANRSPAQQSAPAKTPPKKTLYNKSVTTKPTPVFKNFR